jgi:hypothetical protein
LGSKAVNRREPPIAANICRESPKTAKKPAKKSAKKQAGPPREDIMLARRRFLTGIASAGLTLATTGRKTALAQSRRLIVDSQIHMWPPNRPDRPWMAGAS